MLHTELQDMGKCRKHFHVALAGCEADVRDAQRLRWQVFAEEMGARLDTPQAGFDIDLYDRWCDHLLVRDGDTGEAVGTYRILPPDAARRVGSVYSDQEFDLTRLGNLRERMVEVGRACVHPDYRSGGVITLLWAGLAEYVRRGRHDYLIGCASIGMQDGGRNAAAVWRTLEARHLAPVEWQVHPRCPLPLHGIDRDAPAIIPPLIRAYLRLGAWVCGAPAWDPDFNTADLLTLLPLQNLRWSYARHFLHGQTILRR